MNMNSVCFSNGEMAAYAALVSLLNTLDHIQNHPQLSTSLHHLQIQFLSKNAAFFLEFLESYNFSRGDLENQISSAARAAEVAIESHVVDRIHAAYTGDNRDLLLDLQNIIAGMDSIKEKVVKIVEESGVKDQQQAYYYSMPTVDSSRSTTIGETITVGFGGYSDQLMDLLTGHQSSRQIISIIGMGGIGKTTLARNTFENPVIVRHFDARAWVSVSQDYNVRQIFLEAISHLKELTSKVDERVADEINEAVIGEQLYKSLSGRRYLIVLDDMWSIGVWDKIKFFFPDNDNRSRIILTTRQSDMAICCSSSRIRIDLLDEYESWRLLCFRVFGDEDCPLGLEQTGQEIVKMCRGLPLSITVIGGLLQQSAKTIEYWKTVLGNLKSILSSGDGDQCLNVLYSSYSHLPARLKPCFLHLGTVEEDCEIQVPRITKLWVAEGFIKPNSNQVLEEIAEDYVKDLMNRNLILIGKYGENGKIKSFHIHDLLRDLSISIAKKEKFVPSGRIWYASGHFSSQTILMKCNMRFISYNPPFVESFVLPSSMSFIWNLQTLIFSGMCDIDAPTEIWAMPQLRHVQCNNLYLPDPPLSSQEDVLCVLRNLKTLRRVVNFRWSEEVCKRVPNIKKLSLIYDESLRGYDNSLCLVYLQNLGLLHRLETLRITFPFCISRYPVDLVNKKLSFPSSLNKLCLRNCSLSSEHLAMIGSLPHLQVLVLEHNSIWGGEWSSVDGEFGGLKSLRMESCDVMIWSAEKPAFRVLEKLIVRDLWQLREIPACMGDINSLKLVYLHHCSESAAISALEISREQESYGNDGLRVQVNVSSCSSRSFWARVKDDGLPTEFIQVKLF